MSNTAGAPDTRVLVITVSDRASNGAREDRSGPRLAELFTEAGYETTGPRLVTDGVEPVAEALRVGIAEGFGLVATTGGTGVSPRDFTPEATRTLVTRELTGVAEHLRSEGARHTPLACLTRGVVGVADARTPEETGTLLVNLPGSLSGVEQSMDALVPLLPHILSQVVGWDH
ncbi:MogA/MoaB family molybdenum cofactor biosynthesis protein [Ornithinimicrobium sp. F0845]|uniref:MogA/MoaB family molybdenum cofactor biosynthesis protein n=1 Tax=Ornithinimicrobium sp. F0845 TaxID=2926412 RepID=UPI001FF10FA5|nr:MogA/MoaB family molybdenum cofactor biosynthesis protein [Ornithinimicrobium sp. F0845]MCK0112934.1 MogA/MoaB family molybdenum cofactor biosynthesis protein [Ornithinimicrobium sp. F0845]